MDRARPVPRLIPRHEFFDNPERAAARLSPDGRHVAYLAPHLGQLNVWVRSREGGDDRPVTADGRRGISTYHWTRRSDAIVYKQDGGGDEQWHVYLAPLDGGPVRDLTPFPGSRAMIVRLPWHEPDALYVTVNDRDPTVGDLFRVDLIDGSATRLVHNDRSIRQWLVDEHGTLVGAAAVDPDAPEDVVVLRRDGDGWATVAGYGPFDAALAGVMADGRVLAVTRTPERDLSACVLLDLETGAEEVVASDPQGRVDVYGPILRRRTGELVGVAYLDERLRFELDDPVHREVHRLATGIQPGDPVLGSSDDDERYWIVVFTSDVDPGVTYLLDRETGEHELLYRPRPWLRPEDLAEMTPTTVRSRDGLDLLTYLTVPVGVPAEGLPTVVLVHGGPWSRDSWGFQPQVQFLANRGYAVLQVNYRGSTGFGRAFTDAAIGEFGRAMLDDLVDAVRWAVAEGVTDPERVAVYGGSYGGYAALCGVTFAPETFTAGISMVGPSSLVTLIESFPAYWLPGLAASWYRFVGDPADPEVRRALEAVSPLHHVERIRAPLLVLQGANDPRVTRVESDQIVRALRRRGVTVEYLLAPDEGHGFQDPLNRQAAYRAIELFLAEHLGGRAEPTTQDEAEERLEQLRRHAELPVDEPLSMAP